MSELGFYENYIRLLSNLKDKTDQATSYKIEYLKKLIKNGKVYKFISFDEDELLVRTKIDTLKQKKIWFSFYKDLNDKTEFQIRYDVNKISRETGYSIEKVHLLVNYLTEMYDVYSLTYACQDSMWEDYAAGGNGICIEFDVGNFDYLYPVEYLEKVNIDFDEMIISGMNGGNFALSIIPWVIKNPYNYTAHMDSTKEKEVRILYCPYDSGEVNAGRIERNIKERLGYNGIAKPYADFGLDISKVIFGSRCNEDLLRELELHFSGNRIRYEKL